jgi:drug/metabolite transporter (DMT)-like permease
VVSLFYLTPPVTAILAYLAFGEVFTPLAILGMIVSAVGVAMVTRGR